MAQEVNLDQLNLPRFGLLSMASVFTIRGLAYPVVVLKTRLQVQEKEVYKNTLDAVYKIGKNEGLRGFYKGFGTMAVGLLPGQGLYIVALEVTKSYIRKITNDNIQVANLIGGAAAALASSTLGIPIDVITQRLMLQNKQQNLTQRKYTGGFSTLPTVLMPKRAHIDLADAFVTILKTEGVRGLYKGYGASVVTYGPSSAVWWLSYASSKELLLPYCQMNAFTLALGIALCGGISACTAAITTNPLDVAKTRLQTQQPGGPSNIFSMLADLYSKEGLSFWKRGLAARCAAMSINGMLLMSSYELVKRMSVDPGKVS